MGMHAEVYVDDSDVVNHIASSPELIMEAIEATTRSTWRGEPAALHMWAMCFAQMDVLTQNQALAELKRAAPNHPVLGNLP